MSAPERALHLVQAGTDASVFATRAPSDTLRRQQLYARHLDCRRPGSSWTYVVLGAPPAAAPFEAGGVRFLPVPGGRGAALARFYRALAAAHRRQAIDVITTQSVHEDAWVALAFGARHSVPVVGQVHYDLLAPESLGQPGARRLLRRARRAASLRLLRRLAAVRVVGRGIATGMTAGRWHDRVRVIPVPVTLLQDGWDEGGAAASVPRARRVLYVGRLAPPKNLRRWLAVAGEVAAQDPDARFDVVGDGPLRAELERTAAALGLAGRVAFHGFVPYDELPGLYRAAAALLLTSDYEGFGRVGVEAMAHGTPVVAPRLTGVEDVVEDGQNGFLHPPDDVRGMAASVVRLLGDEGLRARCGAAAQVRARDRFDPDRLAADWVDMLIAVAGGRP